MKNQKNNKKQQQQQKQQNLLEIEFKTVFQDCVSSVKREANNVSF